MSANIREYFGPLVYETVIPRNIRLGEAPSHGLTVYEHDPLGAGSQAYENIADEFLVRRSRDGAALAGAVER